jgi:hypothetical protein
VTGVLALLNVQGEVEDKHAIGSTISSHDYLLGVLETELVRQIVWVGGGLIVTA